MEVSYYCLMLVNQVIQASCRRAENNKDSTSPEWPKRSWRARRKRLLLAGGTFPARAALQALQPPETFYVRAVQFGATSYVQCLECGS